MIKNVWELLQFGQKHPGKRFKVFYFDEEIELGVRVTNYADGAISVHVHTRPDKFIAYTHVPKMVRSPTDVSTLPLGYDVSRSFVKYESAAKWTMDEADDCVMMALLQKT